MDSQIGFIVKVFIFSAGVSVFIKYGWTMLPPAATSQNALIGICLPPLIIALALWWRYNSMNNE